MFYVRAILATAGAILLWAVFVVFGAVSGWWSTPAAPPGDARAFMDEAIEIAETRNRGNVAFVLIEEGEVFDQHYAGQQDGIGPDTVFQAASMSKWITAAAVMNLVEEGRLDLDRPVSGYLSRWQLPPGEFDNDKVTARLLLSHMSGLSDELGFGDYAPGETVPTLEESLSQPRASGGRDAQIRLGLEPGSEFKYSGGGYLLLQLLIEEISGESFSAYVQRAILDPLGMARSTFDYVAGRDDVSNSYDAEGQPAILYRYAAQGATGFATSARDMTRFVQSQLAPGDATAPLRAATISAMREPHARAFGLELWGLGTILYAPTGSGDYIFGHDGQNDPALNAAVRINPDTGDAFIAFVSGGPSLATALGYEWVLWQVGRPDVLHIGAAIEAALPMLLAGAVVILLLAFAWAWRRRRMLAR